jgi:hypothetical protein
LRYLAARAEESLREERERFWSGGRMGRSSIGAADEGKKENLQNCPSVIKVAAVLLTRGGEQA